MSIIPKFKSKEEWMEAAGFVPINLGDVIKGAINKYTGAGLTPAEREANAWTAEREDTRWQREVADMQKAGINPMMAASSGGQSVSSSVEPSGENLSSLLSAIAGFKQLGIQKAVADADIALKGAQKVNVDADTAKKEAETSETKERERGARLVNDIAEATKQYRIEKERLDNALSEANRKAIYKSIDEASVRMSKLQAETDTEYEKQAALRMEAALKQASAYQIYQLLPYEKAYKAAKTDEARASQALSAVQTAYQQGLIDNGYIESLARDAAARAGSAEDKQIIDDISAGLRTGNWPEYLQDTSAFKSLFTPQGALQTMTILLDNLNPLAGLLK